MNTKHFAKVKLLRANVPLLLRGFNAFSFLRDISHSNVYSQTKDDIVISSLQKSLCVAGGTQRSCIYCIMHFFRF